MQESLKELNAFPSLLFLFQEVQLIQSRLYKLPIIVHKQQVAPVSSGSLAVYLRCIPIVTHTARISFSVGPAPFCPRRLTH